LVRRHGSAVRGLLRRLGADPATADDVAQDAFLVGYEQIADYRGEGAFAGWIKKIAARLYLRKVKREARVVLTESPEDEAPIGARTVPPRRPIASIWTRRSSICPRPSVCAFRFATGPTGRTPRRPRS
jgi:DNA-directed RNA polymerase specialized sigma24 family protein